MKFTQAQEDAITNVDNDATILAAAGSGKTSVIIEKVAHLIQNQSLSLERFLIVTFTEKAGNELKLRLSKKLNIPFFKLKESAIGTVHSFAGQQIRAHHQTLGLRSDFQVIEQFMASLQKSQIVSEQLLALAETEDPHALYFVDKYGYHRASKSLLKLMEQMSVRGSLGQNEESKIAESLIQHMENTYEQWKLARNLLDFSDLERYFLKLLQDKAYLSELQGQLAWIIVDEFQDTSPTQWQMISQIYAPRAATPNHLVIVGDPRQSIYGFRGADPKLFVQVQSQLTKNGGKTFYLSENFRSAPTIIELVNNISAELFEGEFPPMIITRHDIQGDVEPIEILPGKQDELRRQEVDEVTERLLLQHEEGTPWRDMALLFRTRLIAPYYEEKFRELGIPYQTKSGEQLLERPEVIAALYLLKSISGSSRTKDRLFSQTLIQSSPLRNLIQVIKDNSDSSLFPEEKLKIREPLETYLPKIFKWIRLCFHDEHVVKNLEHLEEKILLIQEYRTTRDYEPTLEEILMIVNSLREEGYHIPCAATSEEEEPDEEEIPDRVQLMTIHASKGLEFALVVLCDLNATPRASRSDFVTDEEGQVHFQQKDTETAGLKDFFLKDQVYASHEDNKKIEELEESKRLLYVALTRAKEKLILPLALPQEKKSKSVKPKSWAEWIRPYVI